MPRKWREKGGEEDRKCDGRTALREIGRVGEEWRTTATYRKEFETVGREHSERKVRRGKKRQRKDDSNHGNLTPEDRDNKRGRTL